MHRITAALMMALLGALLFAAFVLQDIRLRPDLPAGELPWGLMIRYGLAMTLGGAIAGLLFSGLFGRSGAGGWVLTLIAGILAAAISGVLGSAVGLLPELLTDGLNTTEIVRVAAGLLILPLAIVEQPWLAIVLVLLLVITHLRCHAARRN